jgi:threonine aldolase
MPIDYRSDTVTRPTPAMREAMAAAPVGDDVFGEDPSINLLEERTAILFGMEAAVFCPSGTMTNQIAIKCHTQPGDEVICEENSHIYQYEGGGIAFNAGASVKLLTGDRGRITAAQVAEAIHPDDVHRPVSRLVSLENTTNRGGGCCYDFDAIVAIQKLCQEKGLALHLDGARVWNAIVAKQGDFRHYGATFDSISVCLSKSLGCPVGSLLLGDRTFIKKARRIRKVFGGGMRQAGSLAAAGLFALEHHIDRLKKDHVHARMLGDCLAQRSFVKMLLPVETNIIIFELQPGQSAPALVARLKEKGILAYAISPVRIRLVTHLDISESDIAKTIDIFNSL